MRTFVISGPGRFAYGEKNPPRPGPGEVLLQVLRVGYCGSDLSTFRGLNPLVAYPRIPGHEIAARIVERSADVPASLPVGQPVTLMPYTACGKCSACRARRPNACRDNQTLGVQRDGAMTELLAVPWQKVIVAPLPLRELALVEPLSVGFHAVRRGRITTGDTVAVIGCGMIGLGAIAAAALGRAATVIAIDVDDRKLALAQQAGARHAINSSTENLRERLQALTDGHGPDVVIEAVGSAVTFQAAVSEVAFAGRVVYIGYAKVPVSYETKLFVLKELDIMGSRNATEDDFRDVVALLQSGRYPSGKTVTQEVAWAEAGDALATWASRPEAITKIHVNLARA